MRGLFSKTILKIFPPPHFLTMPSVGIDVSDHTVKFVEFRPTQLGLEVGRFSERSIPDGIVVSGRIKNPAALTDILAEVRRENKLHFIRATLPEEIGYLFELSLPKMAESEINSAIEFRLEENVPIAPEDAVFGYDILEEVSEKQKKKKEKRVVVSVFPKAIAEMYTTLFRDAGMEPLALETEPQAIARSVVPHDDLRTHLIVDYGRERSGISIVSSGVVRFATTTNIGGNEITEAFHKSFSDKTPKQIVSMKNTDGLRIVRDSDDMVFQQEVSSSLEGLVGEIQKHLQYWNTRVVEQKGDVHVSKVILCGGNGNLAGLPEHLSQKLKVKVERANVWTNVFSLERYIPSSISFQESLGYAPAIGLALGSMPVIAPR